MKKMLFIVHEYYPNPSAITNCLKPLIEGLISKGNEIFILTRKNNELQLENEIIDNVYVNRVNDTYENILIKRDNSKGIKKNFYTLYFHLLWKIKKEKISDSGYDVKKMISIGKKIVKTKKIDIIVSCSSPFTSHIIASKIKGNTKWIAYQFDPFSHNFTLDPDKLNKRINLEIKILKNTDKIFITEETYNENIKTELKVLDSKYKIVMYPLIIKPKFKLSNNNKKITMVFAGTLYQDLREPFKMLDILKHLDIDYELHLYYNSDRYTIDKLKKYKKIFGDKLLLNSKKTKEECDNALAKCNIVINIGNSMLNQTPSKVFELISLGKPILNFYTNKDDTSKNILRKYEMCYNVDVNNFEEYMYLKKFILDKKNTILSFQEATINYLKQEEVVQSIIKEVDKVYEN